MTRILLDTGPIFAFYSQRDCWHEWALRQFHGLNEPLLTCEPVLTEASYLLERQGAYPAILLTLLQRGLIAVAIDLQTEANAINILMHRYRDVPMSLADACLVRMSELYKDSRLLTFDSDFRIYRRFGRQVIPLITPWD
ncbi:MAG: type II toxin-antitoxin system VapC family toxin [Limisphaerales bacterium]